MRILSLTTLLLLAATVPAAPALGDRPPKWEYAELNYRINPGRPALKDGDGNEVPAVPASVSIRWVTANGELEAKSWDELAEKLKFKSLKKGSAGFLKIQMLNYFGSEGWELMEQQGTAPTSAASRGFDRGDGFGERGAPRGPSSSQTWLLKRRVP
jgi:hypothetical protein